MPKRREGPRRDKNSSYYFFDEYIGFVPDKKRIRFSLKTRDPSKAQWRWEQEYRKYWSEFYGIEPKYKPSQISLQELTREFVGYEKNIKRIKEWRLVENRLRIVQDCWGDIFLKEIDKEKLTALDSYLRDLKRSEFTINHYFSLLKAMFNYAIKQEKFKGENPINEIKPYTVNEKRREYSAEELERILAAAERIEKEARAYAGMQKNAKKIILLLLLTGMRLGEILNLKWENVKEDKIILKRTETKQKKEKVIPMTQGIRDILEGLKDGRRKNGYVLPLRRKSGKMKSSWANSIIKKIREYSGVQDFIFHNIKHTASTIMISEALGKGVGLADIMKILGHSQIKTTLKYVHPDFERMKKAMEILEKKSKNK